MTAIIETEEDLAAGLRALSAREPRFEAALALSGPPPLRRRPGGYAGLLRIVTAQQLSTAAADGVWRRLEAAGLTAPEAVRAAPDAALRACGLSAQKTRSAREIAEAGLDYPALAAMAEEEAMARLTAIRGVGRWTAEIYLMFCVGRADLFAPGDLALQEGARMLFGLGTRPRPAELAELAAPWSPWRAVAARAIWAYYGAVKRREGVVG